MDISKPERLYHYISVDSDDQKDWFRKVILERQIWFRTRAQLDDPDDLRPRLVFEGTDDEIRAYARYMVNNGVARHLSPAKRVQKVNEVIRYIKGGTRPVAMFHEVLDRLGTFCLSESQTEPQMWVRYGASHRGVCIEFDARVGLFSTAQRVHYTSEPPTPNRIKDTIEEIYLKSVLTKESQWAWQKEWRVLARWSDPDRTEKFIASHPMREDALPFMRAQNGPGYYEIPEGSILSVALGSEMRPEIVAWAMGILSQVASIAVRRATHNWGVVTIEDVGMTARRPV